MYGKLASTQILPDLRKIENNDDLQDILKLHQGNEIVIIYVLKNDILKLEVMQIGVLLMKTGNQAVNELKRKTTLTMIMLGGKKLSTQRIWMMNKLVEPKKNLNLNPQQEFSLMRNKIIHSSLVKMS